MSRVVYVNGRYLPYAQAAVHVEDRGFQFADAVYEVIEVRDGRLVDETRHLARLSRSLNELRIPPPMSTAALDHVLRETVRRNRVRNGLVYCQVTRGAAPRNFVFPPDDVLPTVVCLARSQSRARLTAQAERGIAVKSVPEIRWARCDVKTVMLLPSVLAKQAAHDEGATEAWFVDAEGFVTEGASSNAWIVDATGHLVSRPLDDNRILPGVTRARVKDVLAAEGLSLVERPFLLQEAFVAREAFVTSATSIVMPVVSIDGRLIGDGRPGPVTLRLRTEFHQFAEFSAGR
jgi:D-alanine transaminase